MDDDASVVFRDRSRFWAQRVVVPALVCVGAVGNVASIVVLTRRNMRSSTNAYLTALAIADLIYLFFVLMLSFKHYPNINHSKYELYWRFYGISHWLCDAASSSSVWLTVSFTMERYIVVCHPIKGKVLCTERRAKCIVALVSVLCVASTISTAYEHQLAFTETCISVCASNSTTENDDAVLDLHDCDETYDDLIFIDDDDAWYVWLNATHRLVEGVLDTILLNTSCCAKVRRVYTESTPLGLHKTYKTIFYWFSSIVFGVLPLALIAAFNCFLIRAVCTSYKKRKLMTSSSSSSESRSQSQENRITVLLIAVVVLFLVCQTPTAAFLIYAAVSDDDPDPFTGNIMAGLGNIFNSLLALGAASNFVLYCLFSDRYRRTFGQVFLFRGRNKLRRGATGGTNDFGSMIRSAASASRFVKRGRSDYCSRTPRDLETRSFTSIPRSKSLMQRPIGKARSDDLCV